MSERLTFTLTGRDELSRVLNNTADSSDRLRLRMAGITADADGRLRDLQGNLLTTDDAARRLDRTAAGTRTSFTSLSEASDKLGEKLKANLISLAPAAIPVTAALAGSAVQLAGQLGAVAVAAAAYGLALKPQIAAIGDAVKAQDAYEEAVRTSGATSQEAVEAQVAYQQQLEKMPPATREAAVAVGLLRDNFQDWSDSLSGDVMGPFNKGVAIANDLLPKTTGLAKSASTQVDRLVTMVGGAISTPGFDKLNSRFTDFADKTMDHAVDELNIFLAKLDAGEIGGDFKEFLDFAHANGPAVWETLHNIGDALLNVLQAGSDVGVGMLDVINVLSGVVSAVPPEAIATLLQLAIAIKAVRLAAVGTDAARAALLALGVQVGAMRAAAAGAPGAIGGVTAAIGGLSRGAKIAMAGTGLGLLLLTLSELSSSSQRPKPDVDKLATSITELGRSGTVGGEALRAYGADLSGLSDSLQKVVDPQGIDRVQQAIVSFFGTDSTPVKNAKDDIDALDQSLASLVSSGKADLAAAGLDATIKKMGLTSKQAAELRGELDGYSDSLAGQALEQQMAAESMGLFGEQAQTVQGQLEAQKQSADGLRQSIQALNEVNRSALGGMIGFEAAIDAASKAASENAGVLDMQGGKLVLNSEKQRNAASALNDLAAKTDAATAAAVESGTSWSEVSGIYDRGRAAFIKSAETMGLTRAEAKKLADQIMGTPPSKTTYLKGDLQDLERKLADAKKGLKSVPASKRSALMATISDLEGKVAAAKAQLASVKDRSVTITAHYRSDGASFLGASGRYADGGLIRRAAGGPIPGFPGGGPVVGPGTSTSDSVLLWGSTGEYMVKAQSVRKYGLAYMDALNRGELPVGRSAPQAGRAAAPASAGASPQQGAQGGEFTGTLVLDTGQFLGAVRGTVQPMVREAQSESAYRAKVGRRAG
ncbi:hypothetical protein QA802_30620 [Streptomyces sp. B21-105]|uniref:hypothetical protein n=1 Tax=Streptomyces sp. B21-105 TaxID=3039417 RepID=UPI002FEFFC1A